VQPLTNCPPVKRVLISVRGAGIPLFHTLFEIVYYRWMSGRRRTYDIGKDLGRELCYFCKSPLITRATHVAKAKAIWYKSCGRWRGQISRAKPKVTETWMETNHDSF